MRVRSIDHLVLTVADPEATVRFYTQLGMEPVMFGEGRIALQCGHQKINLHRAGSEFQPFARVPTPGSGDICVLIEGKLEDARRELDGAGIPVELGPVERSGAEQPLRSLYVRDPDGNLVELSEPRPQPLLPPPLPEGFSVGHWTDAAVRTGCTVVLPPPGTRGSVEVRGGGASTRELQALGPLANAEGPTAILLTGGSAFGLAAADGVVRWLSERGRGRVTGLGPPVPLVPAAVIFDLTEHDVRPGAGEGYAACEAAVGGVPERGPVGAGAGAAVGKVLGRDRATRGGVGYAAQRLGSGATVAAVAVANALGDVIDASGDVLGGPRDDSGRLARSAELIPRMTQTPEPLQENTTLVCVITDAALDKRSCAIIARMASAGLARAVDPVFSPADGDVVFCVASGQDPVPPPGLEASWRLGVLGAAAATVTADAIRDAVRSADVRGAR